jgi:urea carboxylase
MRSYLTVLGGIDVPVYIGSKSTFPLGKYGGHEGRILRAGDVLKTGNSSKCTKSKMLKSSVKFNCITEYDSKWEIGVLPGPHYAPDFFTENFAEEFFATNWTLNHNSSRLGCRLDGPIPSFARTDGGAGGAHPSNIIDNPYTVGAINFTGNMPIILGVDGMSMGGFINMVTVVEAELWKVGQLYPGDSIRFVKITYNEALDLKKRQEDMIRLIG